MKITVTLLLLVTSLFSLNTAQVKNKTLNIQAVKEIPNINNPQILYWFWDEGTITNKQYMKDLERMAKESPFDLIFLTSRFKDGVGFHDPQKLHQYLAETVKKGHELGLKIALQLWGPKQTREAAVPNVKIPIEKLQALVVEGEAVLDSFGKASYTAQSIKARGNGPIYSKLLKAYIFKKTSTGFYDASSLKELSADTIKSDTTGANQVDVSINASAVYKGYTAYILTAHFRDGADVFSDFMPDYFHKLLDAYSDIPFDGTALDEFGAIAVNRQKSYERMYGRDFAIYFKNKTGLDLERTLFDMRYAPEGNPAIRISAINKYFEVWREGPMLIENDFYNYSRKIFGNKIFAGVHNTFHRFLTDDDIWHTGLNWWELPREYGQSDEEQPMSERMGIACAYKKQVMYNMYFSKNKNIIYKEAITSARSNVRVHYHAWNDIQNWGKNMSDSDFLREITPIEKKIRLLNHFDEVSLKMPILVIIGFPALLNWYPDNSVRNVFDIRNLVDIQIKEATLWNKNYLCASIPSSLIDKGMLTLTKDGKPTINGRTFDAVIYLYPEYSTESTLKLLENYVKAGGKLMLEGMATADFNGNNIKDRFAKISEKATSTKFAIDALPQLGVSPDTIADGNELSDGSVIKADLTSIFKNKPKAFTVKLNGFEYTGEYIGAMGIKADAKGKLEKFVCGGFKSLRRNGTVIFELDKPTDVVLLKKEGKYDLLMKQAEGENKVTIFKK